MGNQPTALGRVGAVNGKLQEYLASGPIKHYFQDEFGRYGKWPTSVITRALAAGMKPLEFKRNFVHMVDMTGDWRNDRDMVFDVLRRAVDEWHTVEVASKSRASLRKRTSSIANGDLVNGGAPAVDNKRLTSTLTTVCWSCVKPGHLRRDCPDPAKKTSKKDQSPHSSTGS